MKLHDFLESTYVQTNIDKTVSYSPYLQSKTMAVQSLLDLQKSILKWIAYLDLIITFIKTKLKLVSPPKDAQTIIREFNESKAPKEPDTTMESEVEGVGV